MNVGRDILSRDCIDLSSTSHEFLLRNYAHKQVPKNLNIKPLPKEIVSFIGSTLQQLPVQQHRLKQPKISELLRGVAGTLSLSLSDLNIAFTSIASQNSKKISSFQRLPKQFEKQPSIQEIKQFWFNRQSKPPYHMWHRPSGQVIGKTQDWTTMVKIVFLSKSNTEDTQTATVTKSTSSIST